MKNTTRNNNVQAGHNLTRRLNQAHQRHARRPAPDRWSLPTGIVTLGDVVTGIEAFDTTSDHLIRSLLATPGIDRLASDTVLVGLIGGVVHRHRHQPDRIADIITELAIYLVERPQLNSRRHAGNVLLDEANRRTRRSLGRDLRHDDAIDYTDHSIELSSADDTEATALARVELDRCRQTLDRVGSGLDLDWHIALSDRQGNDHATRKAVSRNRRRLRTIIGAELGSAA